jgi:magnesium-protoporphyrin O-methyltransferase
MSEPDRPSEPGSCCFDDWVDHWEKQAKKKPTVAGVTAHLLDALEEAGLSGRTVLDVGCGIGDLALATLGRGAVRATGVDLSTRAIRHAAVLARERGLADRATFEVGDGSRLDLPEADVVVLNRVLCCYTDADALLQRTLAAAGSVYAFTAPVSGGPIGLANRSWTWIWNVVYRIRRKKYAGFQTYVHDLRDIDRRVRLAGFRPVRHEHRRVVWDLAVYARTDVAPVPVSPGLA